MKSWTDFWDAVYRLHRYSGYSVLTILDPPIFFRLQHQQEALLVSLHRDRATR